MNTFPVTYRLQMEQCIPLNNGNLPSDCSASSLPTAVRERLQFKLTVIWPQLVTYFTSEFSLQQVPNIKTLL